MATASDVAQWMVEQLERTPYMYQESIVYKIKSQFGQEFVYRNRSGNWAISPVVLRKFRKLTEDQVVWSRGDRCWRKRRPTDRTTNRLID